MNSVKRQQIVDSLRDKGTGIYSLKSTSIPVSHFKFEGCATIADGRKKNWASVFMVQETISLLENPNYGRFTLRTLKRLARGST